MFYHSSLDFEKHPNDLIFVDEADLLFLDDPDQTKSKLAKARTVGFSSSLNETRFFKIEQEVLKDLGFISFTH